MRRFKLTKKMAIALAKLAKKLPPDYYLLERRESVYGADLIKEGVCELSGKPVDSDRRYTRIATESVLGKELIENGVKTIDKKEVKPEDSYKRIIKDPFPINHERRLRKVYEESGMNGVDQYFAKYGFIRKPEEVANDSI